MLIFFNFKCPDKREFNYILGMHGREVIEQVEHGYRMPKPVSHFIPDDIYRLMLLCWDSDPDKRPTFEFLNHYFEDFTITSEIPYREVSD